MAAPVSIKHALVDKANTTIVAITAAAGFIIVFCLVASFTLFSQLTYQNRIVSAKKQTLTQIKADLTAVDSLKKSYRAFTSTSTNVIGGDPEGATARDGDNAKIVLDALPSKYDFPALANTLEGILTGQNVQIQSIAGTDDSLTNATGSSATPAAVAMPFQLSVSGNYGAIQSVISTFEKSIRPFQIQTLEVSGGEDQDQVTLTITAQTYYQPEKSLNLTTKVVK
jgi:hypothetical protein